MQTIRAIPPQLAVIPKFTPTAEDRRRPKAHEVNPKTGKPLPTHSKNGERIRRAAPHPDANNKEASERAARWWEDKARRTQEYLGNYKESE